MVAWGLGLFAGAQSSPNDPKKKKRHNKRAEQLVDRPDQDAGDTDQQVVVRRGLLVVGAIAAVGIGYWACRRLFGGTPKAPDDDPLQQEPELPIYEYFDADKGVYVYSTDPNFRKPGQRLSRLVEAVHCAGGNSDVETDEEDDNSSASSEEPRRGASTSPQPHGHGHFQQRGEVSLSQPQHDPREPNIYETSASLRASAVDGTTLDGCRMNDGPTIPPVASSAAPDALLGPSQGLTCHLDVRGTNGTPSSPVPAPSTE